MKGRTAVFYVVLSLLVFALFFGGMLMAGKKEKPEEGSGQAKVELPGEPENGTSVSDNDAAKEEQGEKEGEDLRGLYPRIVVLDPACGGDRKGLWARWEDAGVQKEITEKEIVLDVALRAEKILQEKEVYTVLTRRDDTDVPEDDRVASANDIPADLFVGLHLDSQQDSAIYGISASYNEDFYMPEYDSGTFAYDMVSSISQKANEKALGIESKEESTTLRKIMVPGTDISLGCISNMQEVRLLSREDYRQRLAEGIAEGVMTAFTKMEESRNGKDE
ncbi:MAG: N-acetylmuramoyl-L-alanine amidase [Lachnospiraceae bacterium]|nr:N-acetylmuramoyl-L-alanine amidase [Lachnospiraceae bacterium]